MSVDHAELYVRSHVGRDLLQNAAVFRTDKLVVWEYVSNGLQYVDPGVNPVVRVHLDSRQKRIKVSDNGRGMDWAGLQNYFIMHGENVDRRRGRPGRGRFGTGKSAAFGIGNVLRVTTVRNGKRSKVVLTRSDIESMKAGDPVPVQVLEREVPCSHPNGTLVEIEDIHLRTLDQAGVIHYIERHLARWPRGALVFVNSHQCEFSEPPVSLEEEVRPDPETAAVIGDITLKIKVAKGPLEEESRGISIFSNGVWHETTLAGSEGREMAQYIFGEIDVPALDEDQSPISPFDLTRSMRLNRNNELVHALFGFIGYHVDRVRRQLCEMEKQRRATEEARRLAQHASRIADIINEDFQDYRERVAKARARAAGGFDLRPATTLHDGEPALLPGDELPAREQDEEGGPGGRSSGGRGESHTDAQPTLLPDEQALPMGKYRPTSRGRSRPRGGFTVRFDHLGAEDHRARYVREERTIYINLDHPQLAAAIGNGSVDDPLFRRLSYEIAFAEYAIALTTELNRRGEFLDTSEPIWEVRNTLNRVARRASSLYTS